MLVACGRLGFEEVGADAPVGTCATRCGDVTGDGMVDRDDIEALAVMVSTGAPADACLARVADTTGDGSVDDDDLTTLAEIAAGASPRCAP